MNLYWRSAPLGAVMAVAMMAVCAPAAAAPGSAVESSELRTMVECRKLPTKDARADCYDAAVDNLNKAQAEGKVVVIDQEKIRSVRRQAFGFNLPSLSILSRGLREEPISAMSFKLASAHEDADGHWVMETTEQAVWRQTQSSGYSVSAHSGSTLKIHPGIFGAFFCQVDTAAEFRCRRDH